MSDSEANCSFQSVASSGEERARNSIKLNCKRRPAVAERTPAFLPFVKGVTDTIGYLLRRRYSIRTIFRPPGQLRNLLRSPKDKDPLAVPGVYMIPCDCGSSYMETRRNITTRLKEHIRSVKNRDTHTSAIAEHACSAGTAHFLRFDKVSVLAREKYFVPRKVREAIEISRPSHSQSFQLEWWAGINHLPGSRVYNLTLQPTPIVAVFAVSHSV
ncbi:hypothetical protein SFRURICE_009686 [Spodoptera frugiperda]|nr:hypothetical protein SFRURICE_009686 [Spodoptera frugiperda]